MSIKKFATRNVVAIIALLGCLQVSKTQNTIIPSPIQITNTSFDWDTTVFATSLPAFALGHQWGTANLDKLNTALKMNVTSDNFGYLDPTGPVTTLNHLGEGIDGTNFIVWSLPLSNYDVDGSQVTTSIDFNGYWIGLRWEPAENSGMDRSWTPRDAEAWPFSFEAKHFGSIPLSSSDVNYRRFKLQFDSLVAYPVKVLDSVEPRNRLFINREIKWATPLTQSFVGVEDSTDARRLQLVVNLRRTNAADTVVDDSVVVSIVVPYQLRWKDHVDVGDTVRFRMPFRKVPYTTIDSSFDLPQSRGRELKMRSIDYSSEFIDTIQITRRMLPKHSDPGDPDITIVAEFRTDTVRGFSNEGVDTVFGTRRDHILKAQVFDYTPGLDAAIGTTGRNRRYMAIDSLGVTIWYHGTSTPVAIRSASILTPQTKRATSGYWDSAWADMMVSHVDAMRTSFMAYDSLTGRHFKALCFYTCDEFDVQHLLGMRYRLEFLDRRLTSEAGYGGARTVSGNFSTEFGYQKLHGFPSTFLWVAGMGQPDRQISAPYLAKGFEGDPNTTMPIPRPSMFLKQGYLRGPMLQTPSLAEIRIATPIPGPGYTWFGLPVPDSMLAIQRYEEYIGHDCGAMGWFERSAYLMEYQTGEYFYKKRRNWWANFFYHMDPTYHVDNFERPYVQYNYKVPQTGEWVRLQHGSSLSLGCRGFMYDKWRHGYSSPPKHDTLNLTALKNQQVYPVIDSVVSTEIGIEIGPYFPGFVSEDATAIAWDALASVTPDSLLRSTHIGADYLTTSDSLDISEWNDLGTMAASMELTRCHPGDSSQRVYIGRKSIQMESSWWHDLVTDTNRFFKHGVDSSNAYLFMRTRPVGWFGKGYRTLTNGDTVRLRKWVDAFSDSIKVYRWARKSTSDTTLILEKEDVGEQLYDIVLMDTSEISLTDDNCILAITNRRTSPWLYNNNTLLTDSIEFISSYDFDTLTRNSRPDLRYKQIGARRMTIPFNYKVDPTKPYLLHVRELRPAYDDDYTIDTILNWNSELVVDFRPGDTRYFRVNRLEAIDSLNTGYLAFSTQNKLIAYPVAKSDNSGYTDSIRYHMVFHRRDESVERAGPWTVYYQRSIPYHRDSLPLVAGLHWEPAYRLSKVTTNSVTKTDGLRRTLYNGDVDSTEYLGSVTPNSDPTLDCSCGFPSIVVRDSASNKPKIFVVYACEDEWANAQKNLYFHIVENSFLDKTLLDPLILENNGKSLVIAKKNIPHDGGLDTLKSLAAFGTPVINASAFNRMYYAWSSSAAGIGAGLKTSAQDWFPAANAITNIPSPTITWYYSHVVDTSLVVDTIPIDGGTPRYPSLNVYSNVAQNRSDATLVWQEGTTNPHIRYTRLILGGGTAIARMLPAFVEMSYDAGVPPSIPTDVTNAIAIVGGASANEDAELPVVVRSLQKDTMSMFIRDADGSPNGTYKYNHETVAWSEWLTSEVRSRVRYNHFVDMQGFSGQASQLHYWWANTTSGLGGVSLFHPVITNGAVRLDSLTWQGVVDDTLITYDDSLHIVKGNLSDSAIIVNYSVMNGGSYLNLRAQKTAGYASYWTGHAYFASLLGQQIMIRRMPGIPSPIVPIYHYDFLRANGPWPHLSMRLRENFPGGIQSVRRILQYTNTIAPSLFASAEQFYKEFEDGDRTEPATYGGFEVAGDKIVSRAILDNGQSVSFLPVYNSSIPEGFVGSEEYAWQMSSMTTPVSELVSEVFSVGDVASLKILSSGALRKDIELTIEEVKLETISKDENGKSKFSSLAESDEKTTMDFAEADNEKQEEIDRETYYLTNGGEALYRLRMKYTGGSPIVFREDVDIDPEEETFEKQGSKAIQIIDLKSHKKVEIGASSALSIYPNPSVDRVTVIIGGLNLLSDIKLNKSLYLDACDAMGRVVVTSPVQYGEAVDIVGLPTGVYVARIRSEGIHGLDVQASGSFSIIR